MTDETASALQTASAESTLPTTKKPRRNTGSESLPFRLRDLRRLYQDRWGTELPRKETGAGAMFVLVSHLQNGRDPETRIAHAFELYAPWMEDDERDALRGRARAECQFWDADELAAELSVTPAERNKLRLTTIGAVGQTSAERAAIRKQEKNARRKEYRQAAARKRAVAASIKPSQWEREMAVFDALTEGRAGIPITRVVAAVEDHRAFAGIKPKQAVHRAVEGLEYRGLVVRRFIRSSVPGKMDVTRVRRTSAQERALLEPPADAADYERYMRAKFAILRDVGGGAGKFLYSKIQCDLRQRLGITEVQLADLKRTAATLIAKPKSGSGL